MADREDEGVVRAVARIAKVKNFRDLGGIVTQDGHRIMAGRLLRSGHLHRLTEAGARRLLLQYHLRAVIDLRLQSERVYKPDAALPGVDVYHLSPMPEERRSAVRRDNREQMLRDIMVRPDGAPGHMKQDYRELVTMPSALDSLRAFLQVLMTYQDGSVLWHCSQGKDRAGVATAVLLLALGVDREEIMRDYMQTHKAYRWINRLYYAGVLLIKHSRAWARSLVQILGTYPAYLQTTFDTIDQVYGGTDAFLHNGLGLTGEDLARLRQSYLV